MRPLASLPLALLAGSLLGSTGCGFYFGGDDDCQYGGGDSAGEAAIGLRDPYTGLCDYYGGGGGCYDGCGPCDYATGEDRAAEPSWGYCDSYCTGLDELTCQVTAGCRAAYLETCPDNTSCDPATQRTFWECWSTDQTGPVQGSCEGLDAWSCSLHDDCVAVHWDACTPSAESDALIDAGCLGNFMACEPEIRGCYGDTECAADERCNAADVCLPPPDCTTTDPSTGISACDGVCWGWCVPTGDPPPPPACEELVGEDACVARDDCIPYYEGVDCTCDASGCTCADWVFTSCGPAATDTQP